MCPVIASDDRSLSECARRPRLPELRGFSLYYGSAAQDMKPLHVRCGVPSSLPAQPMRCPRCNHENRATARFCEQCASPLSRTCSRCGSPLRECQVLPECAHPARVGAASDTLSSGPPGGTAAPPAGERRQATVVFADISGYTRLCASMDAEHVQALLNRFYALMDGTVAAYGGGVIDHAGDGVLAVFGAPVAYGNDPERAVRAALEMHAGAARVERRVRRPAGSCTSVSPAARWWRPCCPAGRHAQVRRHRRHGQPRRPAGRARPARRHGAIPIGVRQRVEPGGCRGSGREGGQGLRRPRSGLSRRVACATVRAIACPWSDGRPSCGSSRACSTVYGRPEPARRSSSAATPASASPGWSKSCAGGPGAGLCVPRRPGSRLRRRQGQEALPAVVADPARAARARREPVRRAALEACESSRAVGARARGILIADLLDLEQRPELETIFDAMDTAARSSPHRGGVAPISPQTPRASSRDSSCSRISTGPHRCCLEPSARLCRDGDARRARWCWR